MKTISQFALIASGMFAASAAFAQSDATTNVKTRNVEAAHADLMRDWRYRPAADELPGGPVRVRSAADAYANLIRDWQGVTRKNAAAEARRPAVSRTADVVNTSGRSRYDVPETRMPPA